MIKDILRMAVMTSVLLFAMFAFFAFVALLLEMGRFLPQYIGTFMTVMLMIAVILMTIAIIFNLKNK
jgi:hypothetical protein